MKLLKQFALAACMSLFTFVPVFANQGGWGQWGGFDVPTDGTNTFTKTTNSASDIGVAKAWEQDTDGAGGLISAVKTAINWVLWLLALIALCICLWAGWKMLTAAGDAKAYGDGFTMLRQAGIGLVMIGISWLLVSFIFRVINVITNTQ